MTPIEKLTCRKMVWLELEMERNNNYHLYPQKRNFINFLDTTVHHINIFTNIVEVTYIFLQCTALMLEYCVKYLTKMFRISII